MEKDYTYVTDINGKLKLVEIVFKFFNEKNDIWYVLYKHIDEVVFRAGKYDNSKTTSVLDTNLSEEEFEILEDLLSKLGDLND